MKGLNLLVTVLLAAVAFGGLGCGGSRQMQSIAISPATMTAATGASAQFAASAQFNMSPMTVNPASVDWTIVGPGFDPPPPGNSSYSLSNKPFNIPCIGSSGSNYVVIAFAPVDPNAAQSGSMPSKVFQDLVMQHTTSQEGGFIAATAQLTCS
jgi:hypothetical protein